MPEPWNRVNALRQVQARVWRYLQSSAIQEDLPGAAEALFDLDRGQLRRLAAAHIGLNSQTARMLDDAELVLRELPSVVVRSEQELIGVVRGPVAWARTRERQRVTGDRTRFICRPADRRYDTPLARLVHLALRHCVSLGPLAGLSPSGPLGSAVQSHVERAHHLLRHVKLGDVTPIHAMSERSLVALHRYQHTDSLIDFVRRYREAVEQLDAAAVQDVVNDRILAPLTDDRLFELLVGFAIADELSKRGYKAHVDLLAPDRPFGRFIGPHHISLYWQRPTWGLYAHAKDKSRYSASLAANRMPPGLLRPDFILVAGVNRRPLVIEVKQTARHGETPERMGVRETMAYLHDAQTLFNQIPIPHGWVVGWNAHADPASSEIMVSSQTGIAAALDVFLTSLADQS